MVALTWLVIALITAPLALLAYAVGGWFLVVSGALFPWQVGELCVTDTSVKAENVGGFDFEFEDVICDVIGSSSIQMILVSHHGQINDSASPLISTHRASPIHRTHL